VIELVVSGGQTGVDRAALDGALDAGVACGGWCPRGRRAEDGVIAERYQLRETKSSNYIERTRRNVRDSDGTLVLAWGEPTGGTRATIRAARSRGRPCLVVDLAVDEIDLEPIEQWVGDNEVRVLNVAGPRESNCPGVYDRARAVIGALLDRSRRQ
jgi:hypothetical protein